MPAKRKKIIVGNWKMTPESADQAKAIFSVLKRKFATRRKIEAVICPPDLYVLPLGRLAGKTGIKIGVQDVFWENKGFFTGQISPRMVKNAGAKLAIVGHSERRKLGETSAQVSEKISALHANGLVAILCVGESARDPEGKFLSVLKAQILESLKGVLPKDMMNKLIIAYEPIWAIGRPDMAAMDPAEIHETSIFIKKVLNDAFGSEVAQAVPIIYGGSVSPDNAAECVFRGGVQGLLIGRMSLEPEAFGRILSEIDAGK